MAIFKTESGSTYEIDGANKRVRRIEGKNNPTPRQGKDGDWRGFCYDIVPVVGEHVIFVWNIEGADENTVFKTTVTSKVVYVEES